jgi:radical SAM protein with 4Fe4S-binding SPASM domain
VEAGSPRLDRPVKTTLSITERCNLACRLCYADCRDGRGGGAPRCEPELDAAAWRAIAGDLERSGVVSLYIEGGEPLLRDDLPALLALFAERFFVMLRTNGTLVTPELAAGLARAHVGIVLVDLWGATAVTHDALTGVPGSFQLSCAAVSRLLAAGIETQTLLVLNRFNVAELQGFLQLSADLGAATAGILRLYPLGRARAQWSQAALSLPEMTAALEALRPPPGLRVMQSWHPSDANCCWQMSAIDAYGRSMGCAYLREYVDYGRVTERPFLETWDHPLSRQLRAGHVGGGCATCAATQGSSGGCRATAFAFHGRWDAPDPFDSRTNHGLDLTRLP